MDCSCVIDMDIDGYVESICDEWRKAKKQHKCGECYRIIQPGEKYKYEVNKYDDIDTFKTCIDCMSVRDTLFCSWLYGKIWEEVREEILEGNIPESCLAKMTKSDREKICEMIQEEWEDEENEDEGE